MNYEYYKVFYYVALHKNITKAAKELYTSQPNISRSIKMLENDLDCLLFTRNKNGVELTHEGTILYNYVASAFKELSKAEAEISDVSSLDKGTIYIGATITSLYSFLFEFLDIYRKKYPKVTFKIKTDSSNKTIESLKNGFVDLAFVTTPNFIPNPLISHRILEFHDVLIAGNDFAYLLDKPLKFSDLTNYPFIALSKGTQLREFVDSIFSSHNIIIKPDIEPDSAGMIIPLASRNWGLAIVPEMMTKTAISRNSIIKLNLIDDMPKRAVCLVTNPERVQTKASRVLMQMILEYIKEHPIK